MCKSHCHLHGLPILYKMHQIRRPRAMRLAHEINPIYSRCTGFIGPHFHSAAEEMINEDRGRVTRWLSRSPADDKHSWSRDPYLKIMSTTRSANYSPFPTGASSFAGRPVSLQPSPQQAMSFANAGRDVTGRPQGASEPPAPQQASETLKQVVGRGTFPLFRELVLL